jgi:ethanolamine ammonia-lyase large subunit
VSYSCILGTTRYGFIDLKQLLARASPPRAGDRLAGLAAATAEECVAARMALAELPLKRFLEEALIPYESDEVTSSIRMMLEPLRPSHP